jgi:hypothetical protein
VEWKKSKIHHSLTRDPIERKNPLQPDERSDRASCKNPRKKNKTKHKFREREICTYLDQKPGRPAKFAGQMLKVPEFELRPCSCSSSPGLEKQREGDTHTRTHNTILTPFFKSNETGVRFSKPVFEKNSTSKNGKR